MPLLCADIDPDRRVIRVSGADAAHFLQGLVTNDVTKAGSGPIYAALLSPQGKYLADFIVTKAGDDFLLDVAQDLAAGLVQRLGMYRLRAAVQIALTEATVLRGPGEPPSGGHTDPRDPALGWRMLCDALPDLTPTDMDWDALRLQLAVPQSGAELIPNDSYILECGFERLGGVDFRKGCYVGQEVTARMHHKTTLKKGLRKVQVLGHAAPGTEITVDDKPAGVLHSVKGGIGLAYLRFDRATGQMTAGDAQLTLAD